jgi:hypothetical protein
VERGQIFVLRLVQLVDSLSERSEPIAQKSLAEREQNDAPNDDAEPVERIMQLKAKGWGKAKIILEIWGVSKGGSPKYKAAEAEYECLIQKQEDNNWCLSTLALRS